MLQVFQKYNPCRTLCWRFDRVLKLIEHQPLPRRPSRVDDDRYIRGYFYFLLENRDANWKDVDEAAWPQDPALVQAHRLRWSLDAEDRAIVEARILAGETDAEIGKRRAMLPAAVDWYEKLFFCVRDRLDCSDWIFVTLREMVGEGVLFGREDMNDRQRHAAYRILAYEEGPEMLDAAIHSVSPRPPQAEHCPQWMDDALRRTVRMAAMMTVARFNNKNLHILFRAVLKIIKQRRSVGRSAVDVTQNIEAFAKSVRSLDRILARHPT